MSETEPKPNLMHPCQGLHCKGKGEATAELHSCPFAGEPCDCCDDSGPCDCCEECERGCAALMRALTGAVVLAARANGESTNG